MSRGSYREILPNMKCFTVYTKKHWIKSLCQTPPPYTCVDYREEMILLGLRRRLEDPDVPEDEKPVIQARIQKLEKSLNM